MARRKNNTETAQTETNDMSDIQFQDETQTFRTESEEVPSDVEGTTEPDAEHAEAEGQEEAEDGGEGGTRTPREPAYHFNVDDTAMVVRGKYRQQSGKILKYSEAKKTYALELEDGDIVVVNATNLKPPADSSISQRALAEKLNEVGQESPEMLDLVNRLAVALDSVAPEFSVKLNESRVA